MIEPRLLSELKGEEIDALKVVVSTQGWDVMESILLGIKEIYQGELEELERDIMKDNNAQRVGVMRKVIDICDEIISIPEDLTPDKLSTIEKDLRVY